MRWVLVAIVSLAGCTCTSVAERDARALQALDLAEASERVRDLATSCRGLTRALRRLKYVSGRPLLGLVTDAVDAARPRCSLLLDATSGDAPPQC